MLKGWGDFVDALRERSAGAWPAVAVVMAFGTWSIGLVLAGVPALAPCLLAALALAAIGGQAPALAGAIARIRQDPPAVAPVRARGRGSLPARSPRAYRPPQALAPVALASVELVETADGPEFRSKTLRVPPAMRTAASLGLVAGLGVGLAGLPGLLPLDAGLAGLLATFGVLGWTQVQIYRRRGVVRIEPARGLLRAELRALPLAEIRVVEAAPRGGVRVATATRELVIPGGFAATDEAAAFAELLRTHVQRAQATIRG